MSEAAAADQFSDLAPPASPATAGAGTAPARTTPMTFEERLIVQNLFDTQPKKRAAYMKQIGLELDPKDQNKYRPIGSTDKFSAEIDPGVSAYFKPGGLKEFGKDLTDVGFDTMVQTPLVVGGAAKGGAAGAATGAAGGATVGAAGGIPGMGVGAAMGRNAGMLLGAFLGGAAGNAASEELKSAAGDLVLSEDIPTDHKLMALQSFIVGAAPGLMKGGKALAAGGYRVMLEARKKAIINAAQKSGGGLTQTILNKASDNPEMFSDEAVKGATSRLHAMYREIFGTSELQPRSTRDITGGLFQKKIAPLNSAADAELNRLGAMREADWTVGELTAPLKKEILGLSSKFARTSDEDAALAFLRKKVALVENEARALQPKAKAPTGQVGGSRMLDVGPNGQIVGPPKAPPVDTLKINFKQGREVLKSIQEEAFQRDAQGNLTTPGAESLIRAVGGQEGALRAMADAKAAKVGSSLPTINAQRSQVLKVYQAAQKVLTPEGITRAFVGEDGIPKEIVRQTAAAMDRELGTNYSKAIETGAMQKVVEGMYANPKGFGSGAVNTEAIGGAAKGGFGGATAGAGIGFAVGGPPGATTGAMIGTPLGMLAGAAKATDLATPQRALQALGSTNQKIKAVEGVMNNPLSTPLSTPASMAAVQGGDIAAQLAPQTEIIPSAQGGDDLFSDLVPPK